MRIFTFLTTTLFVLVSAYLFAPTNIYAQATTTPILFNQNLKVGSVSPDVIRLQKFLNAHDFTVASSGPGSVGNETVRYGTLTQKAVALFQTKYSDKILKPQGLTKATGNFMKATRDMVNEILTEESKPKIIQTGSRPVNTSTASPLSVSSGTTYTVTITSASHVNVSPNSVQTVYAGSRVTYTVTAQTGYTRNDAVGGTCATGSWVGDEYTTGVINAHCTISFGSTINSYSVSVSGTGDLSISPSSVSTVTYGSIKKFGVTSPSGAIASTVGGTCPAGSWSRNVYSTGAIVGNCTVEFSVATPATFGGDGGGASTIVASNNLYIRNQGGATYFSTDQSTWTLAGWPITIVNSGSGSQFLYVHFVTDFVVTDVNQYFIVDSDNVEFQGSNIGETHPTVFTIYNVTDYMGLLQNGTNSNPGHANVRIRDVFVHAVNSTLIANAGWVAQPYYTGSVINSGSDGNIPAGGGGLIGAYSNGSSVTNSYTTGDIGDYAGGLVGAYSVDLEVNTSYTTGSIGLGGGGLVGAYSNSANVSASYTTGLIGSSGGGIIGTSSTDANIINVYTTGLIGNGAGGIIGPGTSGGFVMYAYTSGNTIGGYGIYGDSNTDGSSNYSEANNSASGWTDTRALTTLTSYNTVWAPITINTPYLLRNRAQRPYSAPSQTIAKGNSSTMSVYGNYYACSILLIDNASPSTVPGITIDSETGVITVADSTPNGTYDVLVKCDTAFNTYSALAHPVTVTD